MKHIKKIIFATVLCIYSIYCVCAISPIYAADDISTTDLNLRNIDTTVGTNNDKDEGPLEDFYIMMEGKIFDSTDYGAAGITNTLVIIAFQIKNFFIGIAAIFLLVAVAKLLFSSADEEAASKWKRGIIWVTVGIVVMQMSANIATVLYIDDGVGAINSSTGWKMVQDILFPFVALLQNLAAFAFIMAAIYAFYTMVSAGGDDEGYKKGKNMVIYAIVGFILMKLPGPIITAIYGKPECTNPGTFVMDMTNCTNSTPDIGASISIFGKVVEYINGFLGVVCVILIVYAGWLVISSGGEEEKLKKAKNIILYILIGIILLVGSHAVFRFFIMQ